MNTDPGQSKIEQIALSFPDNSILQELVGPSNQNFKLFEKKIGTRFSLKGNQITLQGTSPQLALGKKVLNTLYQLVQNGTSFSEPQLDYALTQAENPSSKESLLKIQTSTKTIYPRTKNQATFMRLLEKNELVFVTGAAGTGKTYLSVAMGVSLLLSGQVERLILSRPAIEAGESLGFLPGDLKEKVDPYLRPIYDALHDMLKDHQIEKFISSNTIEIAPLAFMRGRTLSRAFAILDEAQNTTPLQMKMFLTRLGEGSRMVVTGDITQIDLPTGTESGLIDAINRFQNIESIAIMQFQDEDVVRHPLVGRIVKAYTQK